MSNITCSKCFNRGHNRRNQLCPLFNVEVRPTRRPERIQRCDFCDQNHTLHECDDPYIHILYERTMDKYMRKIRNRIVTNVHRDTDTHVELLYSLNGASLKRIAFQMGFNQRLTTEEYIPLVDNVFKRLAQQTLYATDYVNIVGERFEYSEREGTYIERSNALIQNLNTSLQTIHQTQMDMPSLFMEISYQFQQLAVGIRHEETVIETQRVARLELQQMPVPQNLNQDLDQEQEQIGAIQILTLTGDFYKQLPIQLENNIRYANDCDCNICFDSFPSDEIVKTNCNHIYCWSCMESYAESNKDKTCKPNCPACRSEFKELTVYDEDIYRHLTNSIQRL